MNQVQVGQKTYQMPPQDGITIAHFITVADIERSLRFYETVFGSRILSRGDSKGAPGYLQIANTWLINTTAPSPAFTCSQRRINSAISSQDLRSFPGADAIDHPQSGAASRAL
jgi:catechol 2,3-dioxygenase-like lactoylglutathione lyase family enzyme